MDLPDWLSSTLASDGSGGVGALPPVIRPLTPDATVAGPALVVAVTRDDNSPMRDVPGRTPAPGTVLVVAGAGESRTAVLGDLVAAELLRAGVVAVVTDGLIRDSRAVAGLARRQAAAQRMMASLEVATSGVSLRPRRLTSLMPRSTK